jgi:hypothetical protein
MYASQTAVVVTFLHLAGAVELLATHAKSVPVVSMYISPLV